MIRLAFIGDIGLSDRVCAPLRRDLAAASSLSFASVLKEADVSFANLELPFRPGPENPTGVRTSTAPENGHLLAEIGIDVVCLANNHIMDAGHDGLRKTIDVLGELNIAAVGAGADLAASLRPRVLSVAGMRIGFLAFVEGRHRTHSYIAHRRWPGAAPMKRDLIRQAVRALRPSVDLLIVSLHGGLNYVHYASPRQRNFARCAAEAGADIVVGHHPHVLQGCERMGRTLVFHSLGEFLWDPGVGNVVEPRWENARRLTAILEVTVGTDRDMKYRLLPFRRGEDFRLRALEGSEEGNFQRWFGEISSIYENYDSSAYLEGASQGVVEHVFKVIGFHIRQRNLAYLVGLLRRIRPRHLRIAVFHLARKLRGVVSR